MKNHLTEEDITNKIKAVNYTLLEDGKTTIANIYLENGFTVRGESSCVDPKNYDKELGEKLSYENAFNKIWELEGYLLAQRLYEESLQNSSSSNRELKVEEVEVENFKGSLDTRIEEIESLMKSKNFGELNFHQKDLLDMQLVHMKHASDELRMYLIFLKDRMSN